MMQQKQISRARNLAKQQQFKTKSKRRIELLKSSDDGLTYEPLKKMSRLDIKN